MWIGDLAAVGVLRQRQAELGPALGCTGVEVRVDGHDEIPPLPLAAQDAQGFGSETGSDDAIRSNAPEQLGGFDIDYVAQRHEVPVGRLAVGLASPQMCPRQW